jgi:hypothetical protein
VSIGRRLFFLGVAAVGATSLLYSCSAEAATLHQYRPGGAPCAGACSLEWALSEFQVPSGDPRPMIVPAGALVLKMSYAKDGKPLTIPEPSMVFAEDQPATGYAFTTEDGRELLMVKIAECQNWAVVQIMPAFDSYLIQPGTQVPPPSVSTWLPPDTDRHVWTDPCPYFLDCVPPPCRDCEPPPCEDCEPPPIVPLPASLWLMLTAAVPFLRRRRS